MTEPRSLPDQVGVAGACNMPGNQQRERVAESWIEDGKAWPNRRLSYVRMTGAPLPRDPSAEPRPPICLLVEVPMKKSANCRIPFTLLMAIALPAQSDDATAERNALEAAFQKQMSGCSMTGHFTETGA